MGAVPPTLILSTLIPLVNPETWPTVALALGLGTCARLSSALRDGFGVSLSLLGWVLEPALALGTLRAPMSSAPSLPSLPARPAPTLTGGQGEIEPRRWLDRAGVPFLARRLGGSAVVMEAIYANTPCGEGWRGAALDRAILASPGARAVRHRWWTVVQRGRRRAPRAVLSVPAGGGRDAAALGAEHLVLIDPDTSARALAQAAAPEAEVINATVETAPAGPFDLVLYVGLLEYLDDETVVHHLAHLRGRLATGGAVLVTTTEDHEGLPRMRRTLGWHTRPRSASALAALIDRAGLVVDEQHTDPLGIQTVMLAVPRGAGGPES